jgi:hypothetical protein
MPSWDGTKTIVVGHALPAAACAVEQLCGRVLK